MPFDKEFLDNVRNNTAGEELNLSGKDLDDYDILQLCKALTTNDTVLSLNLGSNNIGPRGAEALAKNKFLISLNLNINQIGDEGTQALAQNKTLTSLYLSGNQIGNEGAAALVQGLQDNYALTSFSISSNRINSEYNQDINKLLARNCQWRNQFYQAAKQGDTQTLKKCLIQGASLATNTGYPELNTALHWAVQNVQTSAIKILLEAIMERDVEHYHRIKNCEGITASQLAIILDNEDIIALFQQFSSLFRACTELQNLISDLTFLLSQYNQQPNADKKYVADIQNYLQQVDSYYTLQSSDHEIKTEITELIAHKQALTKLLTQTPQQTFISLTETQNTALAWNEKGVTLYNLGKYEEAIACYGHAIILDAENPTFWCNKGTALYCLDEFEEAIVYYDHAIILDDKDKRPWFDKGRALNNLAKLEEAITCFNEVIKLDNEDKDAWHYKGSALLKLIKSQEALICFEQVTKLDHTCKEAWFYQGVALYNLTKYREAIFCYDQAIKLDDKYQNAWRSKGLALFNLGEFQQQIICFDQVIKLDAKDKEAWHYKGMVLNNLGQYKEAIACHDKAIKLDIIYTSAWCGKAYSLLCEKCFVEAESDYNQALFYDEHSSAALQGKGLLAYVEGQYSKANEYFQKAEYYMPPDAQRFLYYRRGKAFVHFQFFDEAKNSFQKALSIRSDFIPAQLELTKLEQLTVKKNIPQEKKILAATEKAKSLATLEISFQITYDQLSFDKELGRGGFGIVFKGKWQHTDVAIKQLQATQLSKNALEEFQSEMKIMASLNYPNIVRLFGITDSVPYCMVMEYLPKGDLFNLLHSKEKLSTEQIAKIALDIARGLAYLHQKKIMHRDLKSKNILLDKELSAKVADFGLAKVRTETASSSTGKIVGTLAWTAPEIIQGETYTLKADIYSFGVILWELTAREMPFAKAGGNQVLIATWKSMGKHDEIPKGTPKKLGKLIADSWAQKPEERPSAEQAIQRLQTENTALTTMTTTKFSDYRSNLDFSSMDSGYRDNFDSGNNSFRP